ncbi:MAG: chemotaxis protein CheB [Actinomycetota bacterium]
MITASGVGDPQLIVALGASAGGLEPLQSFVEVAPAGAGVAYVLLQHLSPDHPTLMQSLLARHTPMPVITAEDGMRVQADTVYLLPARSEMTVRRGVLRLEEQIRTTGEPLRPIDRFFISMAEDRGDRCVSIVLSGTGSDGSKGTSAVSAAGGLTMAQDASAAFAGMPDAAIRTGDVDQVLEPKRMPDAILAFTVDPEAGRIGPDDLVDAQPHQSIVSLLETSFGIDFSAYKPSTVQRRISRRLEMSEDGDEQAYLERLIEQPEELRTLYHDLLIGVTEFFRDDRPWQVLGGLADELVEQAHSERREVRAWVAGCATGQEAYSVAMTLQEASDRNGLNTRIRVFATDADQSSIEFASAGVYPVEALDGVSSDRRARFFTNDGDNLRVRPELRRLVTFTTHNLLSEAPFTRLDLASCRNLLIYLRPEARARALALLHFSLRVGGVMFLGSSESIEPYGGEFNELDSRSRLFTKLRDVRLLGSQPIPRKNAASLPTLAAPPRSTVNERLMRAYDDLLAVYGPTGFLIDDQRRLVHVFGSAGPLLTSHDGRVTGDLLDQLDESLRVPLWGAIQRAFNRHERVEVDDIQLLSADGELPARLVVTPMPDRFGGPAYAMVAVETVEHTEPEALDATGMTRTPPENGAADTSVDVVFLERELQLTRETLQTTVEELEASNEELVASNEELQSTNEELQSVNEELHTVNSEYEEKIVELTQLTNDLDNLMASTEIGTLFLDAELCVRRFTPDVAASFRIRQSDLGRSVEDFADRLGIEDFHRRLRAVVRSAIPDEDQILLDGRNVLVRMNPYLVGERVDGVVLTLVNVDALATAQAQLEAETGRFEAFMRNSPAMKWALDADGRYAYVNDRYCRVMGVTEEECLGREPDEVLVGKASTSFLDQSRATNQMAHDDGTTSFEIEVELTSGTRHMRTVTFEFEYGGRTYLGGSSIDVTDSKLATARAQAAADEIQEMLDTFPEPVWVLDATGHIVRVNAAARSFSDIDPLMRRPIEVYGDAAAWFDADELETELERPFGVDGPRHMRVLSSFTRSGGRMVIGIDLTQLVEAQRAAEERSVAMAHRNAELDQFAHMASHDLRAPIRAVHLLSQQAIAGDEDPIAFAHEAASTAERMREIIDSLLAFADVGRHEVNLTAVDLTDVVESVRRDLRAELETTGGRIEAGDLPEWPVDPVLLRRAIMNLAHNALVHGGVDEPVVRIDAARLDDDLLEIDVTDNGRGIGPHDDVNVFDPFTRVNAEHPGTGMGLAIARRVSQRHGGSINIARTGPEGTTFRLRLRSSDGDG